jgi:hypothetical protein
MVLTVPEIAIVDWSGYHMLSARRRALPCRYWTAVLNELPTTELDSSSPIVRNVAPNQFGIAYTPSPIWPSRERCRIQYSGFRRTLRRLAIGIKGRRLRSSLSTGKPCTGRRRARNRSAVVAEEASVDSDERADEALLFGVQRKLYQCRRNNPDTCYRELWNWVTDLRNLRCAWRKIASNKGSRTAGIDGMTVGRIQDGQGSEAFLIERRDHWYRPSPCRRKLIPKPREPGKFRLLGIPLSLIASYRVRSRTFWSRSSKPHSGHVSYGFRPGRGCHGALEHIRLAMRPMAKAKDDRHQRAPYQWVIKGDIRRCFGHIAVNRDH